jgi:hypothetical protein
MTPTSGNLYIAKIVAQTGGSVSNLWTVLSSGGGGFVATTTANVTGAANASGLIRLALDNASVFSTNDVVVNQNIVWSPSSVTVNGSWAITVVDGTHIDLQGSTFSGSWLVGGTVTRSPNCMGLYDASGNFIAASIDQSGTWTVGNGARASQLVNPTPPSLVIGTSYYVVILVNVSGGGSFVPTFRGFGTPFAANGNLTGSGLRWATPAAASVGGSSNPTTKLPKTLTPSGFIFPVATQFVAIGP